MPCRALLALFLMLTQTAVAAPLAPDAVPDPLKPWTGWVLWQDKTRDCPALAGAPDDRRCVWPGSLQLQLTGQGGRFTLTAQLFAEQPVTLPGDAVFWPQSVTANGHALPVTAAGGRPTVWLPPGSHTLAGNFQWDRLPATLAMPPELALIELTVDGQPVSFPALNDQGQLWIDASRDGARAPDAADLLKLRVFRRLNDGVPMQVVTHLDLDIAGKSREITLRGALLDGTLPLQLDSGLRARIEPDGTLRLQAQPGHWGLDLLARFTGDVTAITPPRPALPWPGEEIWSFAADPAIRLVEVEGVPAIDPRQTELPEDWRTLPAYRLAASDSFRLRVIRRGDPQPEPDRLTLHRALWLDFDGRGYTVNDRIGGQMTRDWRLNAGDGMTLGRVAIDGEPLSITRDATTGGIGVEVRRGALQLSGDSRLPGQRTFAATGWRKDFQTVSAALNLPPGWRLFAAYGVDTATGAWLADWTLLDFFVVLTLTLAVGRLWGWSAGALALVTLTLLWQEPAAPRYVWLNLLAATALLRVLPEADALTGSSGFATARRWIRFYWLFGLAALGLVAIPFMGQQLRLGLYPQLETPRHAGAAGYGANPDAFDSEPASAPLEAGLDEALERPSRSKSMLNRPPRPAAAPPPPTDALDETDPNAITQTGPGLPRWEWQQLALRWNGPVQQTQELTLVLLSPTVNLLLNVLRVLLVAVLVARLTGGAWRWGNGKPPSRSALLLIVLALFIPRAEAAEWPAPELLNELRARLLAPADCQPDCVDSPWMTVTVTPGELALELAVEAAASAGIPLPAQAGQWQPSRVMVDGEPATTLIRAGNGQLWLAVKPGQHRVTLNGALPAREQLELPLPLKPHRVFAQGEGWRVEGIGEHGVPEMQLRLIREPDGAAPNPLLNGEAQPLPPFMTVERTLKLGLEWRAVSTVRRLNPAASPVTLDIPLLPGEAVLTADLPVRNGRIAVSLAAGQTESAWESTLSKTPQLTLTAPPAGNWTELWRLDASPVWHIVSTGLAAVHHLNPQGRWQPEWRPWAGETVSLSITRPASAPGHTLTLESSDLLLRPGDRSTESILSLSLLSSQGGQLKVALPPDATLQTVTLDGMQQPIRQEGATVFLPVHPGAQTAALNWLQPAGVSRLLRAPLINLGMSSVNATMRIELGRDRWVLLLGGPRLGPAVLFWSVLATLALLAYGLARIPGSPLRFWSWTLLLVGLSQSSLIGGALVAGWLLALAWRGKAGRTLTGRKFALAQTGLAALTLLALAMLTSAVAEGLLGLPAMQIAGHGSDAYHLRWYQDRTEAALPQPWVLSVPLWVYRALMLAWSLWLANAVLNWLRWGWACFNAN